jgi:hypothetical protein
MVKGQTGFDAELIESGGRLVGKVRRLMVLEKVDLSNIPDTLAV